jgi:hypothetical protein
MLRRIESFGLGRDRRLDPFDERTGGPRERLWFAYLAGRGECSFLFTPASVDEVVEAARSVPIGRTDLWVLERVAVTRPRRRTRARPADRRAAQTLDNGAPNAARPHVLIGERGQSFGTAAQARIALAAARALADEHDVRIVVARLVENVPWH